MNMIINVPLKDYKFYGYAKEIANKITPEELEKIDFHFSKNPFCYYQKNHINNLFTFDIEEIAKILGTTKEEIENRPQN